MNRFSTFPNDLLFADTETSAPSAEEATAPAETETETVAAPAGTKTAATAVDSAMETTTTATTTEAPGERKLEGVLEPVSGGLVFVLVLFGLLAAVMVIAMTRYGTSNNYGD